MHWTRVLVLLLRLSLLFAACAHAPSALNDDAAVLVMRQDYLSAHPDGRYNAYIAKGEVVRGMNYLEVSASWGVPETRRLSGDKQSEFWTFFGKDDVSGDWIRYTFLFEKGILVDWQVNRHFTKNGTLSEWGAVSEGTASVDGQRGSSGLGEKKK